MSTFADYLEAKILDEILGGTAFSAPATVYAAAFTANPTDAGGGTEVSGNGYARVAITNNTTNWPAASGTAPTLKSNGTAITWPTASGGNWGAITAIALFDAATVGNMLMWDAITSVTINDADTLQIAIGDFDVTLD